MSAGIDFSRQNLSTFFDIFCTFHRLSLLSYLDLLIREVYMYKLLTRLVRNTLHRKIFFCNSQYSPRRFRSRSPRYKGSGTSAGPVFVLDYVFKLFIHFNSTLFWSIRYLSNLILDCFQVFTKYQTLDIVIYIVFTYQFNFACGKRICPLHLHLIAYSRKTKLCILDLYVFSVTMYTNMAI